MPVHALPAPMRVHMITPLTFNDAQEIGDRITGGSSVFLDMRSIDRMSRKTDEPPVMRSPISWASLNVSGVIMWTRMGAGSAWTGMAPPDRGSGRPLRRRGPRSYPVATGGCTSMTAHGEW